MKRTFVHDRCASRFFKESRRLHRRADLQVNDVVDSALKICVVHLPTEFGGNTLQITAQSFKVIPAKVTYRTRALFSEVVNRTLLLIVARGCLL
jgi:hypothetical protein